MPRGRESAGYRAPAVQARRRPSAVLGAARHRTPSPRPRRCPLQDPPPSVDYPYRPPRVDDTLYQAALPELASGAAAAAARAEEAKGKGKGKKAGRASGELAGLAVAVRCSGCVVPCCRGGRPAAAMCRCAVCLNAHRRRNHPTIMMTSSALCSREWRCCLRVGFLLLRLICVCCRGWRARQGPPRRHRRRLPPEGSLRPHRQRRRRQCRVGLW